MLESSSSSKRVQSWRRSGTTTTKRDVCQVENCGCRRSCCSTSSASTCGPAATACSYTTSGRSNTLCAGALYTTPPSRLTFSDFRRTLSPAARSSTRSLLENNVVDIAAMRLRKAATRDISASSSALATLAPDPGNSCGVGLSGDGGAGLAGAALWLGAVVALASARAADGVAAARALRVAPTAAVPGPASASANDGPTARPKP